MSEQDLLRSYEQKVAELQAELADFQRILALAGPRDAAPALSQTESPPASPPAPELKRDLLEHLSDGFALVHPDGTLSYYNRAFAQLLSLPTGAKSSAAAVPAEGNVSGGRPVRSGAAAGGDSSGREGAAAHRTSPEPEDAAADTPPVRQHAATGNAPAETAARVVATDMAGRLRLMDVEHLSACEPFAAALKSALGGAPLYARCTLTDGQGHRRVVECAATAVPGGAGAFSAALVIRDQTEREQLLAHLTALNTVATALTRSLNFDERLGFALAACREATAADAALIYLIDDERQSLSLARTDGFSPESVAALQQAPLPIGQGQIASVALDGEARALADLRDAPTLPAGLSQREGLVSGAFVALRDAQQITGVLGIYTRARRLFTEADIRLLSSMASHVGLSLHNARLHEQVRQQAQVDSLTGLFNRGHLMDLAAREYQRARRHRSPLMVLMIDVDEFKAVNDSSGHVAGDQALQAVARMLREQTRTFDLVGRYGGDEFVVVLVDCTHAYAYEVIRRLHQSAQAIRIPTAGGPISINLSIGMAACKLTEGETLDQVLAQADREMYAIKNGSATGGFSLPAMG